MSTAEPEPGQVRGLRHRRRRPSQLARGSGCPGCFGSPPGTGRSARRTARRDRVAAIEARRTALVVIPIVGLGWLLVALLSGEDALRIATLVALVVCLALGARAAITTQRFRRRWMEPEDVSAPPAWVTLVTVAAGVGVVVAGLNVAADIQADRSAAWCDLTSP